MGGDRSNGYLRGDVRHMCEDSMCGPWAPKNETRAAYVDRGVHASEGCDISSRTGGGYFITLGFVCSAVLDIDISLINLH